MAVPEPEDQKRALQRTGGALQLGCGALFGAALGVGEGLWWLGAGASGGAYAALIAAHVVVFALLAWRFGDRLWGREGWLRWLW